MELFREEDARQRACRPKKAAAEVDEKYRWKSVLFYADDLQL